MSPRLATILSSIWFGFILVTLLPLNIGYFSISDNDRPVSYGNPIPFVTFAGSSLEWQYDLTAWIANTCLWALLIYWPWKKMSAILKNRFLRRLCLGVLVLLTAASGFRAFFDTKEFELIGLGWPPFALFRLGTGYEIVGVCLSTSRSYYLGVQQGFFCVGS